MYSNLNMKSRQKDLQYSQASQIKKMLNFNKTEAPLNEEEQCVWKIIIFDKYCQDILSTLFKVPAIIYFLFCIN